MRCTNDHRDNNRAQCVNAADRIYEYAKNKKEPVRVSDLTTRLQLKKTTVEHELCRLIADGLMVREGKLYRAVDKTDANEAWVLFIQKIKPTRREYDDRLPIR